MTGNPVSWFGIHATDLDRAKKFYETVFGETLQEVGGGGMRFMIFGADWAKYGVSGMLWSDGGAVPGYGGTTVFFNCTDCAETARAAVGAAGAAEGVGQHFIVFGAFGLVFQGVVGEVDFAGFLVGIGVFADIGVVLAHQLAVGLFDVGQAGIFGHAEDVVVGFLVGTHILDILWNG